MNEQDKRYHRGRAVHVHGATRLGLLPIAHDIVWHVPDHNPVWGEYYGYHSCTQLIVYRMMPLDRWDFTLGDVMVNGNLVIKPPWCCKAGARARP